MGLPVTDVQTDRRQSSVSLHSRAVTTGSVIRVAALYGQRFCSDLPSTIIIHARKVFLLGSHRIGCA